VLAEYEPDDPSIIIKPIDDPGYRHNKEWVDRCFLWLERWGVLPDELARQDKRIIVDIELRAAMKSQIQREYWTQKKLKDDGPGQLPAGWS
jgi:hypothetical protein